MARVLVVDDAAFMRKVLGDALASGGHEVVGQAANGNEAVRALPGAAPRAHDARHHDAREGRPRRARRDHGDRPGRASRDVLGARSGDQGARVDQARRQGLRRQAIPSSTCSRGDRQGAVVTSLAGSSGRHAADRPPPSGGSPTEPPDRQHQSNPLPTWPQHRRPPGGHAQPERLRPPRVPSSSHTPPKGRPFAADYTGRLSLGVSLDEVRSRTAVASHLPAPSCSCTPQPRWRRAAARTRRCTCAGATRRDACVLRRRIEHRPDDRRAVHRDRGHLRRSRGSCARPRRSSGAAHAARR